MNASKKAAQAKEKAKRPTIAHYIATKRGLPCSLVRVIETQRAGALVPSAAAQKFVSRRRLRSAIKRTERLAAKLRGSLHRDWLIEHNPNARELMTDGTFAIVPITA